MSSMTVGVPGIEVAFRGGMTGEMDGDWHMATPYAWSQANGE